MVEKKVDSLTEGKLGKEKGADQLYLKDCCSSYVHIII